MTKTTFEQCEALALATLSEEKAKQPWQRMAMRIQAGANYAIAREMEEATIGGVMSDDIYAGLEGGITGAIMSAHLNAGHNGVALEEATQNTITLLAEISATVMERIKDGETGIEVGFATAGGRQN